MHSSFSTTVSQSQLPLNVERLVVDVKITNLAILFIYLYLILWLHPPCNEAIEYEMTPFQVLSVIQIVRRYDWSPIVHGDQPQPS